MSSMLSAAPASTNDSVSPQPRCVLVLVVMLVMLRGTGSRGDAFYRVEYNALHDATKPTAEWGSLTEDRLAKSKTP